MKLVWAALIIVAAAGIAVAAMLLVRRNAPDGGYFNDGDRASGVFGVLATGFSVLLGFIVFLTFETYDGARAGAEVEALTVAQQGRRRVQGRHPWPGRQLVAVPGPRHPLDPVRDVCAVLQRR